jgi:hypothetical protein
MSSTFLFAENSFLTGLARTLDLGAQFDSYNESITPEQADAIALLVDWVMVGGDLQVAIKLDKEFLMCYLEILIKFCKIQISIGGKA